MKHLVGGFQLLDLSNIDFNDYTSDTISYVGNNSLENLIDLVLKDKLLYLKNVEFGSSYLFNGIPTIYITDNQYVDIILGGRGENYGGIVILEFDLENKTITSELSIL